MEIGAVAYDIYSWHSLNYFIIPTNFFKYAIDIKKVSKAFSDELYQKGNFRRVKMLTFSNGRHHYGLYIFLWKKGKFKYMKK